MTVGARMLMGVLGLVPVVALADVGKVATLDGQATRTPRGGAAVALAEGASIELGDAIHVKKGHLKIILNDESVMVLGTKSQLVIEEAQFEGLERKGFLGRLNFGKFWTSVKGGGKFEVKTDKAVAGVRGTIFRIDAETLVKSALTGRQVRATVVRVTSGVVGVNPTDLVKSASGKGRRPKPKGPRREVPPPHVEVGVDEWERRFAELQANRQVAVGVDLWELAEIDEAAREDAFAKWIEAHP